MTILMDIINAMKKLGGTCHLNDLYKNVDYPNDSIRQCLYFYSSDSKAYKKTKDIFHCVYGVDSRKGIWSLRENINLNENDFHKQIKPKLFNRLEKNLKYKAKYIKVSTSKNSSELDYIQENREGELIERKILARKRNRKIVELVKDRDNYTCQCCNFNFYNRVVEAHHLVPISNKAESIINKDDLITLCPNCHSIAHYLLKEDELLYSNKEFLIEKIQEILSYNTVSKT